jgi:hypothetical protein
MSTALSATGKIVIPYTYSGISHKMSMYCKNPTLVGGTYNINSRTLDANDIVWTDAAQQLAQMLVQFTANASGVGQAVLQHWESGLWIPKAYYTVTPTGQTSGQQICTELTYVLRDKLNHPVKVVMLEGVEVPPQHWVNPLAGSAVLDSISHMLMDTTINANSPFAWAVGRGNQYLADTPIVGITLSFNRKLRRRRGLA